ncbi:MAG: hypothetical protein ACXWCO_05435 [Caldimonas sp.]
MVEPGSGSPDVQDGAPQAGAVTFRRSKSKVALWLPGGLLFVWLGIGLLPSRPVAGLLSTSFGAFVSAVFLASLVLRRPTLRLDRDGLELTGLLGKTKAARWADVGPPYLGTIASFDVINVPHLVARDATNAAPDGRRVVKEIPVLGVYGASLRDILLEMQDRHRVWFPDVTPFPAPPPQGTDDISWKTFGAAQAVLLALYVAIGTAVLDQALVSTLHAFVICLGFVGVLFTLAVRTIRWGGTVGLSYRPHPRFPKGRHPRPRRQFLTGMLLTSVVLLLLLWPWHRHG